MASHPRIAPVSEPDEEQSALLSKTLLSPGAEPLNLFTTLAHHPLLMKRVNALGGTFMAHGSLGVRVRELVILRVAYRVGSEYERAQHEVIALKVGIDQDELEKVRREPLDGWSDEERPLLAAVDELCANDDLSDGTWSVLSETWTEAQLLELLVMIGFYRMLGGVLRTARVQVDASVARTS